MKEKFKKHILENINKKTIKQISQELNLKEKEVKKVLSNYTRNNKSSLNSQKEEVVKRKKIVVFYLLLITILGLAVYINSINGKFICDDYSLIKENVSIKSFANLSKIFYKNKKLKPKKNAFFRPLPLLTYAIDYSFWKLNVKGYHLTNILLHILVGMSIFWLITLIFKDQVLSFFTSLLFIVHPIHTEAVSYLSGRNDLLAVLFLLLCFICYTAFLKSNNFYLYPCILLSFFLALFSKENSLILPVLLILYHFTFHKEKKKNLFPLLSLFMINFCYLFYRFGILRSTSSSQIPESTALSLNSLTIAAAAPLGIILKKIPGFFVAITNYFKLLLLPFGLHLDYGEKIFSFFHLKSLLGMSLLVSLLLVAFFMRKKNKIITFSILWFFLALLPVADFYPVFSFMAEHYLYLPSIGFFLLLAKGLTIVYKKTKFRIATIIFLIILTGFYAYLTVQQNTFWRTPLELYKRTLNYNPSSVWALTNLGSVYREMNQPEKSLKLLKKAVQLNPHNAEAYTKLAAVYHDMNNENEAIELYKKALEIDPDYEEAFNNMGSIYYKQGNTKKALRLYKKALEIDPYYAEVYYNFGNVYKDMGKKKEAVPYYQKAIEIDPDYLEAYFNLGVIYYTLGKKNEAIALFNRGIEIDPTNPKGYFNLGNAYFGMGKQKEAAKVFEKGIEFDPTYLKAYINLGSAYYYEGMVKEAINTYQKAIEIDPNYGKLYYNLSVIYFEEKEYKSAIEYYDKAAKFGIHDPKLIKELNSFR